MGVSREMTRSGQGTVWTTYAPIPETAQRDRPSLPCVTDSTPLGPPPSSPSKSAAARSTPKWETATRDRIKTSLRRFARPLADLVARDANEGDTRILVTDMLTEALGYDKYEDLTTEYAVKGEFADYGIRLDQQLVAFVEVKRATTKLSQRHLRQVEMYAVNEGVEWMYLTNGVVWQVYRLIAGLPVTIDLVLDVDLLADDLTVPKKAEKLFYISKESMKRGQIEDVWRAAAATAPKSLAEVVLSEGPLDAMRKELKRRTGHAVDNAELGRLLRNGVLDPGVIE